MAIQLFVPTFNVDECLSEIKECLDKGWTGLGYKTVQFEEEWNKYNNINNSHFLNSATAGLNLAVEIFKDECGWSDGDEIITTPLTFISTNHAITLNNMKAVFADIDDSLCLDPKSVLANITSRTKAVIFVGLGGNSGELPAIAKICKDNNLKLILDASHMAGTRINGASPALFADVTIYSFQAVKNLPTADSGMICFKDEKLDKIARKKSWLGINKDTYLRSSNNGEYKWKYDVEYVGYKYHGNSIMAGIGIAQLKVLERDNAYRRQIAKWYEGFFEKYSDKIQLIKIADNCESSRHLFQIIVENRDELLKYLNENEIYPGVHYVDNTLYRMYSYANGACPKSMEYSEKLLSLPIHMRLTHDDVKFVAEKIIEFINKR